MVTHEERLLAVLEKIGQEEDAGTPPPSETAGSAPEPSTPIERAGIPDALAPVTRKNLFAHYDAHPVIFDIALLHQYGADWYAWEPATLWHSVLADFHVSSISDHNKSKIQAIRTLHINEWFWTQWEVFGWVTQALNGNIPDFQILQKPSPAQVMCSVDVAAIVRDGEEFGDQVQMFMAAALVDDGVCYAPNPISFCQDEIERLLEETGNQHVKDLLPDVRRRFLEIIELRPEEWTAGGEAVLRENEVDVQAAKLKVAYDYLQMKRRQLKSQLELLR